jgi:hypothetical protein
LHSDKVSKLGSLGVNHLAQTRHHPPAVTGTSFFPCLQRYTCRGSCPHARMSEDTYAYIRLCVYTSACDSHVYPSARIEPHAQARKRADACTLHTACRLLRTGPRPRPHLRVCGGTYNGPSLLWAIPHSVSENNFHPTLHLRLYLDVCLCCSCVNDADTGGSTSGRQFDVDTVSSDVEVCTGSEGPSRDPLQRPHRGGPPGSPPESPPKNPPRAPPGAGSRPGEPR